MRTWGKIIMEVKSPLGYATLALLVIMTVISLIISYQTQNFILLLILFVILCIYTIAVLYLLTRRSPSIEEAAKDPESKIKTYPNVQSLFQDMTLIIEQSVSSPKETKVEIMGLTLYHMWEYIKNFINKQSTERMNIFFCMVDSSSSIIKNLGNNWDEISDGFYNSIQKYIQMHEESLRSRSIKIQIKKYKHLPIIHGVLINEEHLFLGFTSWTRKDQMEGALNFFSYYNLETSIGKYHIEIFKNWINHIKRNKCDQLCMKSLNDHTT
jgi:hypothetical protein